MKHIYVAGAIIIKEEKILCAQRGKEMTLPDLWEFPGGKIEPGETPQQALMREINEEFQIDVEVEDETFLETVYTYDFGCVHLTTFICKLSEGAPVLIEHQQVKWLSSTELNSVSWAPADIPVVNKLMKECVPL